MLNIFKPLNYVAVIMTKKYKSTQLAQHIRTVVDEKQLEPEVQRKVKV